MKVNLTRKLVLEERVNVPDGKGGFAVSWSALGEHWADVDARTGSEGISAGRNLSKVRHRIIIRGAPFGSPKRPNPDHRFREGPRIYAILAVSEFDSMGRYLECWTEEGKE